MTETAFVLILMFQTWDDCMATASRANLIDRADYLCEPVERERALAPETSPRPRARGEK